MLEEAAAGLSVQERSRALKQMGSGLSAWTSRVGLHLSISAHREQLDPTVELLAPLSCSPICVLKTGSALSVSSSRIRLRQEDGPELASVVSTWIFLGERPLGAAPRRHAGERGGPAAEGCRAWLGRSLDPKKLRWWPPVI